MAERTIDASIAASFSHKIKHGVVVTAEEVAYIFFIDSDNDVKYYKTTTGWAAESGPVTVYTGTAYRLDVFHEEWNGGGGNLIHIFYMDSADATVRWRTLDPSDDSLGTEETVHTGVSVETGNNNITDADLTGVVARGGNIHVQGRLDLDGESFHARSTDGGATWDDTLDNLYSTTVGDADWMVLIPGGDADANDIWVLLHDDDQNQFWVYKYDQSADAWGSAMVLANRDGGISGSICMDAVFRQDENSCRIAFWQNVDVAGADCQFWKYDGSTVTQLTDIATNRNESFHVQLLIVNQEGQYDTVYAVILGDSTEIANSSVNVYWTKTEDDGVSWSPFTQLSTTQDDLRWAGAGYSIGDDGGRFRPIWQNDDLIVLLVNDAGGELIEAVPSPEPEPEEGEPFPEYGQVRSDVGNPSVYGATILRS